MIITLYDNTVQVSVEQCTEGIIRVGGQQKLINPLEQEAFEWTISSGLNSKLSNNCTGELKSEQQYIASTLLKVLHYTVMFEILCIYISFHTFQWCY